MKQFLLEFLRRGAAACGLGPMVLAVLYGVLHRQGALDTLTVDQVCRGIFSLSALAFVAGGLNVLYQIERLPLMAAILIHGSVLYVGYLGTYLLNSWLEWGRIPILVFSGIFVFGYLVVWMVIYVVIKRKTRRINRLLRQKQKSAHEDAQ